MEECRVCGGKLSTGKYDVICAQEFGPCGMLTHRPGKKINHTKFHRSRFKGAWDWRLVHIYFEPKYKCVAAYAGNLGKVSHSTFMSLAGE